jgi:hypothetical protein
MRIVLELIILHLHTPLNVYLLPDLIDVFHQLGKNFNKNMMEKNVQNNQF